MATRDVGSFMDSDHLSTPSCSELKLKKIVTLI